MNLSTFLTLRNPVLNFLDFSSSLFFMKKRVLTVSFLDLQLSIMKIQIWTFLTLSFLYMEITMIQQV